VDASGNKADSPGILKSMEKRKDDCARCKNQIDQKDSGSPEDQQDFANFAKIILNHKIKK